MKTGTTVRASVAIFVSAAFLWMLVLGVSPQLHSRVHSDANSFGDFAEAFESGVLNEKNNFIRAGRSPGSGRFRTGSGARCEFIAGAKSFKCNAGYRSGHASVARASAIPHGDSESVARTSERSTSRFGKGKPHG